MGFIRNILAGVEYMKKWPDEPLLYPVFAECRIKKVITLEQRLFPPFIVLTVIWYFYRWGGFKGIPFFMAIEDSLPMLICCICFLLLLPLQGYYWFYKRSMQKLNDKQKTFYIELCTLLKREPLLEPTLDDLINNINVCIKQFGKDPLKKL